MHIGQMLLTVWATSAGFMYLTMCSLLRSEGVYNIPLRLFLALPMSFLWPLVTLYLWIQEEWGYDYQWLVWKITGRI